MENYHMRWIKWTCLLLLCLVPTQLSAKPDFTELEKLVPEELKERNTPGAVIAIVSGDGKQVLSPAMIGKMFGHHVAVPGEKDAYYAYGLTVFKYKGVEIVGHGGFSRGYGSMIQMVPTRKFAVIVLTNRSGETLRKTLNKATELALGLKEDEAQKPATVADLTAAEMQEYVGSYSHAPQTWDVSIKDGKLYVKVDGGEHQLTRSGDRKFTFGASNENELVFVPGQTGKIEYIFTGLYAAKRVL